MLTGSPEVPVRRAIPWSVWTGLWSWWARRSSGSPPPGPVAFVPVAPSRRELQVYEMGDKSPRNKDKKKKQSRKKKTQERNARDKKQAPKIPLLGRT